MRSSTFALAGSATLLSTVLAAPATFPFVDTRFPYTGAQLPNSDPLDPTAAGNGKGFPRVYEPPAVSPPPGTKITNNINIINLAYVPGGMNIHFSTPYDIAGTACVDWGTSPDQLSTNTKGYTNW